jgi:hypothetical protein
MERTEKRDSVLSAVASPQPRRYCRLPLIRKNLTLSYLVRKAASIAFAYVRATPHGHITSPHMLFARTHTDLALPAIPWGAHFLFATTCRHAISSDRNLPRSHMCLHYS